MKRQQKEESLSSDSAPRRSAEPLSKIRKLLYLSLPLLVPPLVQEPTLSHLHLSQALLCVSKNERKEALVGILGCKVGVFALGHVLNAAGAVRKVGLFPSV